MLWAQDGGLPPPNCVSAQPWSAIPLVAHSPCAQSLRTGETHRGYAREAIDIMLNRSPWQFASQGRR
jgi:hypothetical protein